MDAKDWSWSEASDFYENAPQDLWEEFWARLQGRAAAEADRRSLEKMEAKRAERERRRNARR
jgi:hypothetical protein